MPKQRFSAFLSDDSDSDAELTPIISKQILALAHESAGTPLISQSSRTMPLLTSPKPAVTYRRPWLKSTLTSRNLPRCELHLPEFTALMEGFTAKNEVLPEECKMWDPSWNEQIGETEEAFMKAAGISGYSQDQSLLVLHINKFSSTAAQRDLKNFRSPDTPAWSEEDRLMFHHLSTNYGKNLSRIQRFLPHIPRKELVKYYYLQKNAKKREMREASDNKRRAWELTRRGLIWQNLNSLKMDQMIVMDGGKTIACTSCLEWKDCLRLGDDHNMCATCYSFFMVTKTLPALVAGKTNPKLSPPILPSLDHDAGRNSPTFDDHIDQYSPVTEEESDTPEPVISTKDKLLLCDKPRLRLHDLNDRERT